MLPGFEPKKVITATGHIESFYDERRGTWRLLRINKWTKNAETFYNDQNEMLEFESEALAWESLENEY